MLDTVRISIAVSVPSFFAPSLTVIFIGWRVVAADEWQRRLTVDPAAWAYGGLDAFGVHLAQESFHPSAAGHAELGRCVGEFLRTSGAAAACRAGADGHLHVAPSPPAKAAA